MFTYFAPLAFVLTITLCKEGWDDIKRLRKDREINSCKYECLNKKASWILKNSSSLKVGDLIKVHQNERFPADCILLHTTERSGSVFIRTD